MSKLRFNSLSLPIAKKFTSRYIMIDISFKPHPNIGSAKDIDRVPQTEIIPEIYGEYSGESSFIPHEFTTFHEDHLVFVKSVRHLKKYTINSENSKVYLYDSDNAASMISEDSMRDINVQSEAFASLVTHLIIDELVSRGSSNLPEDIIKNLLEATSLIERGKTLEKIASLLKKIAKNNKNRAVMMFGQKFYS